MAHTVSKSIVFAADALRRNLDRLEVLAVKPDKTTVEELLVTLDEAEAQLAAMEDTGVDIRGEAARFQDLVNRIGAKPELIANAARALPGGMKALRASHAPAENFWWRSDELRSTRVRSQVVRFCAITLGVVVAIAGGLLLFNWLFPPDPQAVAYMQATAAIERASDEGNWDEANRLAQEAIVNNDDPELLAWAAVTAEKADDDTLAATLRQRVQTALQDMPLQYWILMANRYLRIYELDKAHETALVALEMAPDDAEVALLVGRVAMEEGDRATALTELDRAYNLAVDTNPQLAVSARVLYGELLRQIEMPMPFTEDVTDTVAITATTAISGTTVMTETTAP